MATPDEKKQDRPTPSVPPALSQFKDKAALQSHLFGPVEPLALWELPIAVPSIPRARLTHFANLDGLADAYRLFSDDKANTKPQQDLFILFWHIWTRFERAHPFLYYPVQDLERGQGDFWHFDRGFKRRLGWMLLYARWYYLQTNHRLPIILPLLTFPGSGYFQPPYESDPSGHMTIVLIVPYGTVDYAVLHIDTSGASRVYTRKWHDQCLLPLMEVISDTYDKGHVQVVILDHPIQKFGSCATFSFMLALDIIRSPPSRWADVITRLKTWSRGVGKRASQRRAGVFLGNAGLVFKRIAQFVIAADTLVRKQGFRGVATAETYLQNNSVRQLWREKFSAKVKTHLEKASFINSEALLLPDAKQLAKMKRADDQARRILRKDPARPPRVPRHRPKLEDISASILSTATPPRLYQRLRPNRDRQQRAPARSLPPPLPPFTPPRPPALPLYSRPRPAPIVIEDSPPRRVFRRLRKVA